MISSETFNPISDTILIPDGFITHITREFLFIYITSWKIIKSPHMVKHTIETDFKEKKVFS